MKYRVLCKQTMAYPGEQMHDVVMEDLDGNVNVMDVTDRLSFAT